MSDGLNKLFMDNPANFMRTFPINIAGQSELEGATNTKGSMVQVAQGVHEFDLEYGERGAINLRAFARRKKDSTWKSKRITAYWLPWTSRGSASLQLGGDADFFFTSALGGCRMQIGPGATPKVMHIAGDMPARVRELEAQAGMGADFAASRRFSNSTEYPLPGLAFFIGYVEKQGFMRNRVWRFAAQGIQVVAKNGHTWMEVSDLSTHHQGVLIL